jgi:hypothetical protein
MINPVCFFCIFVPYQRDPLLQTPSGGRAIKDVIVQLTETYSLRPEIDVIIQLTKTYLSSCSEASSRSHIVPKNLIPKNLIDCLSREGSPATIEISESLVSSIICAQCLSIDGNVRK